MLQRTLISAEPVRPARPGSTVESACTVSALVKSSDKVLREAAGTLWVRGEISGWKRYASGHCYFTLKDDRAEIQCVLFADAARALPALPENGMEVCVFGQVGIYPKKGQFQFTVQRLATTGWRGSGSWRTTGWCARCARRGCSTRPASARSPRCRTASAS
jgi:exodeoxyribonuclease VII large subunit